VDSGEERDLEPFIRGSATDSRLWGARVMAFEGLTMAINMRRSRIWRRSAFACHRSSSFSIVAHPKDALIRRQM